MFCECGTLVVFPEFVSQKVQCRRCNAEMKIDLKSKKLPKTSFVKDFCKKIDTKEIKVESAKIKMQCPGCGADELSYNTAQLRSADEGQTVFYTCEKCGFKDTVQS